MGLFQGPSVLVILTFALFAASIDAQRRSKGIAVTGSASGKGDFRCPEEFGYYPHPTDCSLYYVCVFGGALQESCTGGLMYSHELQTCDWPRNVGCGAETTVTVAPSAPAREQRYRYNTVAPSAPHVPPPHLSRVSPNPVVTSRGQPRHQLQQQQDDLAKQLYEEVDDVLPPAEEIENDRQQRVYRGQPSTVGQVQRDRDGLSNTNAIPSSQVKVGSFAFGTQVQQQQPIQRYRVEPSSAAPQTYQVPQERRAAPSHQAQAQVQTQTLPKGLYNGSQSYDPTQYEPYYAVYDDDVELYRDVDYAQQYNTNSQRPTQSTYRGTPAPAPTAASPAPTHYQVSSRDPPPREQQVTFVQASPTPAQQQDASYDTQSQVYQQQQTNADYEDALAAQIDDQNNYRQANRQQIRTKTRGRGNSQYTTGSDGSPVVPNRGTHPPRSRPTLKPSTSIVSKAQEFVDIYRFPASRPEPVYPTPQVDKTAAKCRKDVCLLPDCSCGGKEIPGDLPVEDVPQLVMLTFDDSVNDLNKGLYSDLFDKGRVNPNGCPIAATFYVSHEWTDYSQVQNLYSDGHEMASHTVSHSFGEQFSQKKWTREVAGQREILAAYGGVKLEDVRGMRAPFLSVGGNKMFKMLYDSNFTYDSSMPVYENKPPSYPYTLDYKLFHDCMIPPCPTRSYPGVWEVPMVMWQDLNGGRCSMGDACSNPPTADGVYKMLLKNFERHYTTNRAPFGLFYHAAWFTQAHHKEGFIAFLDTLVAMKDVFLVTNWQALQWVRDPTPISRINSFQPLQCDYSDRPKKCSNPKVCNLWHKSGVRYMRTCQPCPEIYPWTGKTGIRSSRIDNDIED